MLNIESAERLVLSPRQMRWLLVDMKDEHPDLGVKFKIIDHGWQSTFYRMIHVSETHVVLMDEKSNQLKMVSLTEILQFSINRAFKKMAAHSYFQVGV
jgi:hypothetical protein